MLGAGLLGLAAACTSGSPSPSPTGTPTPRPTPLGRLEQRIEGKVLRPGSAAYKRAARLYDPRYDGMAHPIAVAQVQSAEDVAACVRWATEASTPLHVRAGGHSYGGWSSGPGLVVDLRGLDDVQVSGSTATIGGGALLAPVYGGVAAHGMALAAGSCPTVGLSGLTLGGGVGVLSRAYGLTCDAVRGATVVTADGELQQAGPDLLWALRGGGGSFGVVTSWEMALRPAPKVVTFFLGWGLAQGPEVLAAWQEWMRHADRRLWSTCKLLSGKRSRALVAGTWIGPPNELFAQLAPLLRGLPKPPVRSAKTLTYADAMLFEAGCGGVKTTACVKAALAPPLRQAFTATSLVLQAPLTEVDAAVSAARRAATVKGLVEGGLSFDALGGAVADVAPAASAFPWRTALATVQVTATWQTGRAKEFDAYVRGVRTQLAPHLGPAAYSNYADAAITDYTSAYWGANYPRLQQLKRELDPQDVFSWPQSVRPAG